MQNWGEWEVTFSNILPQYGRTINETSWSAGALYSLQMAVLCLNK
jgi:hypothetical protein